MGEEHRRSTSSSSSGEEDGDAEWRAAIDSVVTDFGNPYGNKKGSSSSSSSTHNSNGTMKLHGDPTPVEDGEQQQQKSRTPKLYLIKAQKMLEDIIGKSLEFVADPVPVLDNNQPENESGVRLFRDAPVGIIFDRKDEYQGPKRKPRILPGEEADEKSKKFKRQLKSVVVEGVDIMAAAREACQKSLSRFEAKDAAAKAAAKREEDRISELKKIRGEKWLPSIAEEMQLSSQSRQQKAGGKL